MRVAVSFAVSVACFDEVREIRGEVREVRWGSRSLWGGSRRALSPGNLRGEVRDEVEVSCEAR